MRLIDADALMARLEERKDPFVSIGYLAGLCKAQEYIDEAPTIKQNKWILCSEKLPDNGDIVIVSIRDETGDTKFNYSSYGWVTTNKEYWIVENEINNYVVAWMPLPEPYELQESEE